jgi:aldehyde dehydrogenase (NAD+)
LTVREFEAREDEVLAAVTAEMGALRKMKVHTRMGIDAFKKTVVTLRAYDFQTRIGSNVVRREPIGVCGLITAWNWPVQLI